MGVVREHYMRDDIPCAAQLCFENCSQKEGKTLLPSTSTHYLLPLEDVASDFIDVLASSELRRSGVIVLQSVATAVQRDSQRRYRKLCALVRDPESAAVFFPNEFCSFCHVARKANESSTSWSARAAFAAAEWYYEHLGAQKPVVMVTENAELVSAYGAKRVEVFVVTLDEYLAKFWSGIEPLRTLYENLADSKRVAEEGCNKGFTEFVEYLKPDLLEAGLKRGKFVKGRLEVNKYHSQKEAFVIRASVNDTTMEKVHAPAQDAVLIPGITYRNRAVHGDTVVVELLPKRDWRPRLAKLAERRRKDEDDDEEEWDGSADVCPTGRVVGVLERRWREYVASVPREEADAEVRKSSRRVLVLPYDRRVPKVRIWTAQTKKLANERFVVAIDSWPVNSQYPNGHFVRTLGVAGDLETEIDSILLENGVQVAPFSAGVLREMPDGHKWRPDDEEVARRKVSTHFFTMRLYRLLN